MLNTERLWGGEAENPVPTIMGLGVSLLFLLTALPLQAAETYQDCGTELGNKVSNVSGYAMMPNNKDKRDYSRDEIVGYTTSGPFDRSTTCRVPPGTQFMAYTVGSGTDSLISSSSPGSVRVGKAGDFMVDIGQSSLSCQTHGSPDTYQSASLVKGNAGVNLPCVPDANGLVDISVRSVTGAIYPDRDGNFNAKPGGSYLSVGSIGWASTAVSGSSSIPTPLWTTVILSPVKKPSTCAVVLTPSSVDWGTVKRAGKQAGETLASARQIGINSTCSGDDAVFQNSRLLYRIDGPFVPGKPHALASSIDQVAFAFFDFANKPLSLSTGHRGTGAEARYVKLGDDSYTASTQLSVVPVLLKTDGAGGLARAVAVISVWSDVNFVDPSA
ncbi:hypothetical protein GPY51_08590 [Photorhabdus laumondii subsp. laumondii]|uniref:Photorhabdus luminescens subsp. laumondii TTO1 complete genome segment 3/17 n=2 Tax=Photorhabdus laumondii subsp. laumondii TaxID=141679 RepID=Q7N8E2_PHOLL|nr:MULTISPECIES: hypothetical protein [Photorhabdus]AWK40727.1 hypothetical protein A4R40_03920 [Photorhabdus laumondii subsp. laumondii]AXG41539.1 hypothetical protein PluDJC_04000 [Photorhabdus laumondii subsp. laumondii]AXG46062.1 hypothetical protein PluTT01m_04030 [Photorhabdus laumondii subsp. laumondii]MCC8384309.1 hypothetical protein [Photorhabdus laumondii]MCC8388676.1 hypothetical protein [Photorhabdus laumondii]